MLCVSGDGSFLMNVQELAILGRYRLPVKIVLLDNQRLGMVRQWQELIFEQRYSETDLSDNPDFVALPPDRNNAEMICAPVPDFRARTAPPVPQLRER